MSGGQMMVVLIVAIVMIASIIKARYGHHGRRGHGPQNAEAAPDHAETARLREDVRFLKERVAVLERIATDKNHLLEAEFERLRDR